MINEHREAGAGATNPTLTWASSQSSGVLRGLKELAALKVEMSKHARFWDIEEHLTEISVKGFAGNAGGCSSPTRLRSYTLCVPALREAWRMPRNPDSIDNRPQRSIKCSNRYWHPHAIALDAEMPTPGAGTSLNAAPKTRLPAPATLQALGGQL